MIHQYKMNGYNIVLDVYSGSVHSVDDVAYDVIELYNQDEKKEEIIAKIVSKYTSENVTVVQILFLHISFLLI